MNGERLPAVQVLVIDDDSITRERTASLLDELSGIEVRTCDATAVDLLDRGPGAEPHCVVIDLPMRAGRGFALLPQLRSRYRHCLIIAMLREQSSEFTRHSRSLGADHCLYKTHEFEQVLDLVQPLLDAA